MSSNLFGAVIAGLAAAVAVSMPVEAGYVQNGNTGNGVQINGILHNGHGINAVALNGVQMNGRFLNALGYNGGTRNALTFSGTDLNDRDELRGWTVIGIELPKPPAE
ncbi:MAG TPA: hypothetical protein VFK86_08050 [Bauldia sp.]|nr:hypothetical protein [Bauldia sp.]